MVWLKLIERLVILGFDVVNLLEEHHDVEFSDALLWQSGLETMPSLGYRACGLPDGIFRLHGFFADVFVSFRRCWINWCSVNTIGPLAATMWPVWALAPSSRLTKAVEPAGNRPLYKTVCGLATTIVSCGRAHFGPRGDGKQTNWKVANIFRWTCVSRTPARGACRIGERLPGVAVCVYGKTLTMRRCLIMSKLINDIMSLCVKQCLELAYGGQSVWNAWDIISYNRKLTRMVKDENGFFLRDTHIQYRFYQAGSLWF